MRMKNKNKQDSLSKSSEKKGDLLIQVNELMEKLENDYGPLMLEELQKRLIKTIEDFQTDVSSVLAQAFENRSCSQSPLRPRSSKLHSIPKRYVPDP